MDIQYISALFLPRNDPYRPLDKYIYFFEELVSSGISIGLYLDPRLEELGMRLCKKYSNVKVLKYTNFDLIGAEVLPANRNEKKDTIDYLSIQLMKMKCMADAAKDERIKTDFLAWIDFGVFHMFTRPEEQKEFLRGLTFYKKDKIYAPGCWELGDIRGRDIWNTISWRFCGSFFIGWRGVFQSAYEEQQALVKENLPRITWEINYWSIMSCFEWYKANHDDTLFKGLLNIK